MLISIDGVLRRAICYGIMRHSLDTSATPYATKIGLLPSYLILLVRGQEQLCQGCNALSMNNNYTVEFLRSKPGTHVEL